MKYLLAFDPVFKKIGAFYQNKPYRGFITLFLALALIPLFHRFNIVSSGSLGIFAYIIMMSVVALGLNLLLGFSGLISLGTAGFVGAGALGLGVFLNLGLPFELSAVLTLIIATGLGALIGLFSLKVEGIYLAIATLFVGEILRQIYTTVPLFGGQSITIGRITFLGFFELSTYNQSDRRWLFMIILGIMIVMMILMYHIVHSKTGRAFLAMSRSSSAAQAMGVSLLKYRLLAFSIATFFATTGGIMYGLYYQFTTTTEWTLNLSLLIIAMVVVGGYKSIYGTLLGVFIIHGIPNFFLKEILGDVSFIFSGLLIIFVILFYQNGAAYVFTDLRLRYMKHKMQAVRDE